MKLSCIIMGIACLSAHSLIHTIDDDIINKAALNKAIEAAIEKHSTAIYTTIQRCVEKVAYTGVGIVAALCGCFLATSGIKRTFCEKKKVKSGLGLTCAGIATVFIGLTIATT